MESNLDLPSGVGSKNRFRDARRNPDFTIDQDWVSYSAAEHDRWDRLFRRSLAALQNRACDEFLAMIEALSLSEGGIPHMAKLSGRLENITGWRVVPVPGLVPDDVFFNHLANRRFPAGAFIRPEEELDYLREPDIFHDIFGHVPLLANPVFADFLVAYGKGGQRAIRLGRLANLARLYWYAVEFGLIQTQPGCESLALEYCHPLPKAYLRWRALRQTALPLIYSASCAPNTRLTISSRRTL
jgi:phenylalanine-4-hydroxylase